MRPYRKRSWLADRRVAPRKRPFPVCRFEQEYTQKQMWVTARVRDVVEASQGHEALDRIDLFAYSAAYFQYTHFVW